MVEQTHISAKTVKHGEFFVMDEFIDGTHNKIILTVT